VVLAFAFPIIVAVAVSNATCAFFAHASESSSGSPSSVYHLDLERNEKVVFLPGEPPRSFKHLTAADLMCSGPVKTVRAEGETPEERGEDAKDVDAPRVPGGGPRRAAPRSVQPRAAGGARGDAR
jgi:hypothetical protein